MALTDLLRVLDADAEQELAAVLQEQELAAARILDDARAEARRHYDEVLAAAEAAADDEERRILAEAAAAAGLRRRDAVAAALAGVHATVTERVTAGIGTPEGVDPTLVLLAQARVVVPDGVRVHVHPAYAAAVQVAAPDLEVVGDLDDVGVVLSGERGRRVVNTGTERLANLWPSLRPALAAGWGLAVEDAR